MSKSREIRALVVDDEKAVQTLMKRALTEQGFVCDTAADGNEAIQCIGRLAYDVVVTDLRMPNKHGHALVTELLGLKCRPVIVVHTSIIEPKLAKDLLVRGVDDIMFKPFDLGILAVKVRALVDRRVSSASPNQAVSEQLLKDSNSDESKPSELLSLIEEAPAVDGRVTLSGLKSKLASLSRILPISTAAIDVFNMTSTDQWETEQIAAAIQRDATLAAEVLRLANSSFYNPSAQRVVHLERAVVQIGQKRVGELSLATNALTVLTSAIVPWMDVAMTWKQSMAAGLALERLIECGKYQHIEEGLLLSAIMNSLGRIVLGTLYPKQYELMIQRCVKSGDSLQEQERHIFPLNHSEVAAALLSSWNIPADVHLPLKHIANECSALKKLSEPNRTKTELVNLAVFIGRAALGHWEAWDWVDVPSAALLEKLKIRGLAGIITQTREDVDLLATLGTDRSVPGKAGTVPTVTRTISYCDLSQNTDDLLMPLLLAMGINPIKRSKNDLLAGTENILVNSLGSPVRAFPIELIESLGHRMLFITNRESADACGRHGRAISLPNSYSRLRAACWQVAEPIDAPCVQHC